MRRHIIWYALAALWGAIAILGLLRHRAANAGLEALFAVLFVVIGIFIKRRDGAVAAHHTAKQPK
jgi:hypothetical protein